MLKSKMTKKGDLCICLIDHKFPPNDDEINLTTTTHIPV